MTTKHIRTGRPRSKAPNAFGRWIESTGLTYEEVAKKLERSIQHVSNLRNGNGKPSRELATKIASISAGAVPASSWDKPKRRVA